MADYASTVTLYTRSAERISRSLGVLAGKINITNYNSTTTKETKITNNFRTSGVTGIDLGILALTVTSSENGYLLQFDKITGKFKGYYQSALAITNPAISDPSGMASVAAVGSVNEAVSAYVSAKGVKIILALNSVTGTAAVFGEVALDTDMGEFEWIAIGFIGAGH